MGLDHGFNIKRNNEMIYEYELRKVNCIQGYFEKEYEIQNGDIITILKEDIEYLYEKAKYILENQNDLLFAKEYLPIQVGFFYGNYDYNEYYFEDIEETYQISKEMLEIIDKEKNTTIEYWCWY